MTMSDAHEMRIVELETRLAFQEQAVADLSDALAALRIEASHSANLLRRVLDDIQRNRSDLMADPAQEPPPPHY